MAIIDVRQLRSLRISESKGDKNSVQLSASEEYLAVSDVPNPSLQEVASNTAIYLNIGGRIPQVNDYKVFSGFALYVTSRDFEIYDDNENIVKVTIRYDAKSAESPEPKEPQSNDSDTWQNMTLETVSQTVPATGWVIRDLVPDETREDPDFWLKEAITAMNSASDPVDGLTKDASLVRMVYTNTNVEDPDFSRLLFYCSKCNNGEFLEADDYHVKVNGYGAEFDGKTQTWSVRVEFLYNPFGWWIEYMDAGFNEKIDYQRRGILDKSGNPVSKPVPLDGNGTALTIGADPIMLKLYPYPVARLENMFSECRI